LKKACTVVRFRVFTEQEGTSPLVASEAGDPPSHHPASPASLRRLTDLFSDLAHQGKDREALQFTYISRALPRGSDKVAGEALIKHRQLLGTEVPLNLDAKESLLRFSKAWGARFKQKLPDQVRLRASDSSCWTHSRRNGGVQAALRELVDNWFDEPAPEFGARDLPDWAADEDRFTELGEQNRLSHAVRGGPAPRGVVEYACDISADPDAEKERIGRIVRDAAIRKVMASDDLPQARVTVVMERGYKARIVTKSPAEWVEVGHLLRGLVWPMLAADSRVKSALEGSRLKGFVDSLQEDPVEVPMELGAMGLVSADLTSATDGLASWAILAVWDGVCEGAGIPDGVRDLGRRLLGPMVVQYDRPRKGEPRPPDYDAMEAAGWRITTKRGCLMGLPLSWFILNLCNLWAAEQAVHSATERLSLPTEGYARIRKRMLRAGVCGDDLAALLPMVGHAAYRRSIESLGSSLSPGKHLLSERYLLFTEQIARFRQEMHPAPAWTVAAHLSLPLRRLVPDALMDVVPIRSLVQPDNKEMSRRRENLTGSTMPEWAVAGPAILSGIPEWCSVLTRRRVARVARTVRPEYKRPGEALAWTDGRAVRPTK